MPATAVRPPLPRSLEPQLCTLAPEAPCGDDWLHEIKHDGWRLLARKEGRAVRLYTRGGHEWAHRLPRLAAALTKLPARSAWLDGELVLLGDDGISRFEPLAGAIRSGDESRLFFHAFDAPWLNGRDLHALPLVERKARLQRLLGDADPRLRYTAHVIGRGPEFFAQVNALDLEGIVSKAVDSPYRAGERTRHWLKVKCWRSYEFVAGGIERDELGRMMSVLVGSPSHGGGLRYEGRVEFGLGRLRATLAEAREIADSPFVGGRARRNVTWIAPSVALAIRALPRRDGELLRHASAA